MLYLKTFYVHIKPILQDWTVAETLWKLARSLSRSSWCPKAFLRAAHYFKPFVLKRYQKRLIVHRYILRVTPVLPKFEAKSTHDPKPCQNGPSAASAHAFRFRPPPLPSHQSRRASAVTNPKSAPPPAPRNSSAPANFPKLKKESRNFKSVVYTENKQKCIHQQEKFWKPVYQKVNVAPWCIPPKCETLARFYYTPPTNSRKTQNFEFFRVFGPTFFPNWRRSAKVPIYHF